MLDAGADVRATDPVAAAEARHALGADANRITFVTDAYEAARGADALVIMTEWNEYRNLDLTLARQLMQGNLLADTRNVLDPRMVVAAGFDYLSTGRQSVAGQAVLV
jgi:UDPglucose 6-dehydrogenase